MKRLPIHGNFKDLRRIVANPMQCLIQIGQILLKRDVMHKRNHQVREPFFVQIVLQYDGDPLIQCPRQSKGGPFAAQYKMHLIFGVVLPLRDGIEWQQTM